MKRKNSLTHGGVWLRLITCLVIIGIFPACSSEKSVQPIHDGGEELIVVDAPKSSEREGWTLTFEDTFTGEKLDDKKWGHAPEWKRHNGQWSDKDAYLDGDGQLIIQISEKEGNYYSGAYARLDYLNKRTAIMKSVRQLPIEEGFWTAFWLMSDSVHQVGGEGKDGTEIDIFETPFARYNKIDHALHWV